MANANRRCHNETECHARFIAVIAFSHKPNDMARDVVSDGEDIEVKKDGSLLQRWRRNGILRTALWQFVLPREPMHNKLLVIARV
jgi:hypothetical protein